MLGAILILVRLGIDWMVLKTQCLLWNEDYVYTFNILK